MVACMDVAAIHHAQAIKHRQRPRHCGQRHQQCFTCHQLFFYQQQHEVLAPAPGKILVSFGSKPDGKLFVDAGTTGSNVDDFSGRR